MQVIEILGYFLVSIYTIALIYVSFFCLSQLHLLLKYLGVKRNLPISLSLQRTEMRLPSVTIQLPVFNEKYVVGRLIDNIILLKYPKEKLEIQILDDSNDETKELIQQKVAEYSNQGFNIKYLHRFDRTGFKAGALKEGMKHATGEFIAIFDADFLPENDFLIKTIPSFADPQIGVVQTRWEHINQKDSLLTEIQAFQLNVHFTVEQKGRYNAGYMLQFNGTAGLWRKSCIEDAGGWEADTLTEDLDLSYRAQLKGWKIMYLEDVSAPAELPTEINGLKSQQFRWMKGGAETARKMLPKVWDSKIKLSYKIQATIHLLSSSIFLFVFILGVFSFPLLFFINPLGIDTGKFTVFLISLVSIVLVYFVANFQVALPKENKVLMALKFIFLFPVFLALSMGLAFHNSLAVLQGFAGKKSLFIRTPKYGINRKNDLRAKTSYSSKNRSWVSAGEGILSLYFSFAVYYGWTHDMREFLLFHIMLAFGYLTLFVYAIKSEITE